MGSRVRYVSDLAELVEPVADWANRAARGRAIFQTEHLLLPTNSVKAWLPPELANHVGVREGKSDGVIANLQVGYIGSLNKFIVPQHLRDIDPWSIEAMIAAILGIIADNAANTSPKAAESSRV